MTIKLYSLDYIQIDLIEFTIIHFEKGDHELNKNIVYYVEYSKILLKPWFRCQDQFKVVLAINMKV